MLFEKLGEILHLHIRESQPKIHSHLRRWFAFAASDSGTALRMAGKALACRIMCTAFLSKQLHSPVRNQSSPHFFFVRHQRTIASEASQLLTATLYYKSSRKARAGLYVLKSCFSIPSLEILHSVWVLPAPIERADAHCFFLGDGAPLPTAENSAHPKKGTTPVKKAPESGFFHNLHGRHYIM